MIRGCNRVNGVPINQAITFGDAWYVDYTNGDDENTGVNMEKAVKTISKAVELATTNNNDVIFLSAYAAHEQTAMLTIEKSRLHFVSTDCRTGFGMGSRCRITMGVTTDTADIAIIKNTGVGNTFTGIKFDSGNTLTQSLYAVAEAGEYTIYDRCEFYKSTHLDSSTAAEVLCNGDSTQYLNCVFGSTVNIVADNYIRPNLLCTPTEGTCRDNIIDNCIFLVKAAGTEAVRIYGANGAGQDVERFMLVKNSTFISNTLGAATPAHAVGFAASQSAGVVILQDCTSVDHTVMKQASRNIYVSGAVPTHGTTGIAVTG